jgi:hypothetical protein
MTNQAPSALGPSVLSTLVCKDLTTVVGAYCQYLCLTVYEQTPIDRQLAELWGTPELEGALSVLLANACGEPWLRLVEDAGCEPLAPLKYHGWLSLEVLVEDVDQLVSGLQISPFELLRPAANLELSDNIRAAQVSGPCGEVMYLTQIKGDVPPFDLPRARCEVDRLFIPVMCTPDRAATQAFYERFPNTNGLAFDTKITVVNQAYGLPLETQHPVTTLMLSGQSLIEADEISEADSRPVQEGHLPPNIASISFEVDDLDTLNLEWRTRPRVLQGAPYNGRRVGLVVGPAGEWVELLERASL